MLICKRRVRSENILVIGNWGKMKISLNFELMLIPELSRSSQISFNFKENSKKLKIEN